MQGHPSQKPSESQARRATALKSALGPLMELLTDDLVVEIMLNADGAVWVEKVGAGMLRTGVRMAPADAERMLRLIASEMSVELTASSPSLSGKLPPPWGARVQASIPPIVDAPTFALRKPARVVFSLGDYEAKGTRAESQQQIRAMRLEILSMENQCQALNEICRALLLTIEQAACPELAQSAPMEPSGDARISA